MDLTLQVCPQVLTEEHSEAAVDLLCNHFFKDEPLGRALHLDSPREVDHWLSNLLPYMVPLSCNLLPYLVPVYCNLLPYLVPEYCNLLPYLVPVCCNLLPHLILYSSL